MYFRPAVSVVLLVFACTACIRQPEETLTRQAIPDTLGARGDRVGAISISPNGHWLLFERQGRTELPTYVLVDLPQTKAQVVAYTPEAAKAIRQGYAIPDQKAYWDPDSGRVWLQLTGGAAISLTTSTSPTWSFTESHTLVPQLQEVFIGNPSRHAVTVARVSNPQLTLSTHREFGYNLTVLYCEHSTDSRWVSYSLVRSLGSVASAPVGYVVSTAPPHRRISLGSGISGAPVVSPSQRKVFAVVKNEINYWHLPE